MGVFPKISTSVWYSIYLFFLKVKTRKGDILDKYLNFIASILEVFWAYFMLHIS